jgi:hypothetical protein
VNVLLSKTRKEGHGKDDMAGAPDVCHAKWHDGIAGNIFLDCCDANVRAPLVWQTLNEVMGTGTGT